MSITFEDDRLVYHEPPPPVRAYMSPEESRFADVGIAFEALADFRLLTDTGQLGATSAYRTLMNTVRYDTYLGHQVGIAAENYLNHQGSYWELQVAFADWANRMLVRMLDTLYEPERLPLTEGEMLDRWAV